MKDGIFEHLTQASLHTKVREGLLNKRQRAKKAIESAIALKHIIRRRRNSRQCVLHSSFSTDLDECFVLHERRVAFVAGEGTKAFELIGSQIRQRMEFTVGGAHSELLDGDRGLSLRDLSRLAKMWQLGAWQIFA